MPTSSYVDYILDILAPLGNIRARKMFGGYGIYKDTQFFALIIDDALYFKVGDGDRALYESYGSKPFSYTKKNGASVSMSYWQVPMDILENPNELALWTKRSVSAAKKPVKLIQK